MHGSGPGYEPPPLGVGQGRRQSALTVRAMLYLKLGEKVLSTSGIILDTSLYVFHISNGTRFLKGFCHCQKEPVSSEGSPGAGLNGLHHFVTWVICFPAPRLGFSSGKSIFPAVPGRPQPDNVLDSTHNHLSLPVQVQPLHTVHGIVRSSR